MVHPVLKKLQEYIDIDEKVLEIIDRLTRMEDIIKYYEETWDFEPLKWLKPYVHLLEAISEYKENFHKHMWYCKPRVDLSSMTLYAFSCEGEYIPVKERQLPLSEDDVKDLYNEIQDKLNEELKRLSFRIAKILSDMESVLKYIIDDIKILKEQYEHLHIRITGLMEKALKDIEE